MACGQRVAFLFLLWLGGIQIVRGQDDNNATRTFEIDYLNDQFLMDGKPFRYVAGSVHYFRVPRVHWADRFERIKAAGLNAVQTYIEWSQHEPEPGVYDFDDDLDFEEYFRQASNSSLYVILRAGPYICAERDMGGLPYWLLRENPQMRLRTNDQTYVKYVDRWLRILLPKVRPHLYVNGGAILAVQVENEYGSYFACDWDYMNHLRDLFREELGDDVVLFTTDGNGDYFLKCGKIQGLYATVDFGPGENVTESFHAQRNHEPRGPLVNSEYYTGGHTHWGYGNFQVDLDDFVSTLEEMLDLNASISMYMFHGGTSFGFTNGANEFDVGYVADLTSYDFGAPLAESGRMTEQFFVIRETLRKYTKQPLPPVPPQPETTSYGTVPMQFVGTIFDLLPLITHQAPVVSKEPLTFEALGQAYGFVLYETKVPKTFLDPDLLTIENLRDRGYVFLDYEFRGILSRMGGIYTMPIVASANQTLSILVENQGRLNYGSNLNDFKGLLSVPRIGDSNLTEWKMTLLGLNNTPILTKATKLLKQTSVKRNLHLGDKNSPAVYMGEFVLSENLTEFFDTFLLPTGWHKGVAFLNNFNLGRYWPQMGPQVTLYVPGNILRPHPDVNSLILLELQQAPCSTSFTTKKRKFDDDCVVHLVDHDILNGTTPRPYR